MFYCISFFFLKMLTPMIKKKTGEVPEESYKQKTDEEMYELILELSSRYLTPSQLDILRYVFAYYIYI